MKKVLVLTIFTLMLGGLSGCRVAECWRYAWNSRFHPERNVVYTEPSMMVDPCDPCCDNSCGIGCGTPACGAPAVITAPVSP